MSPETEAGIRLLDAVHGVHAVAPDGTPYWDHIRDIEAEAVAARDAEIATVTRQRDLLANAVVHVIGRPGRPGECPICRGAEPCEADDPAIQLAAGMFAGASEAELAAIVEHP